MPRTFFPQAKAAAVDKLLENINVLLSSATMDLAELNHYQQQLEKHLEHPKDISARTIRRMRKTLAELNSYVNEDEATDVIRISSECCIQIPSPTDLAYMTKMPAGGAEDQQSRLTHMSELVLGSTSLPVKTTDEFEFNKNWQALFKLIDLGKKAFALRKVEQMAETEPLLQLILTIHPIKYLQTIINHCIEAQARGYKRLNSDIVITPKTFELLIKDLALSLNPASPLYFSFGLPSHHAFNDLGSGFCLFNKTALVMKNAELNHAKPLKYVVIGTDVNRDNGLCEVLNHSLSHLEVCHVDIFDSRVYPGHNVADINLEFTEKPKKHKIGINEWQHHQYHYYAVDLAQQPRAVKTDIHPALLFALNQLEGQITAAKTAEQLIMLLLPTGWDSHQDETAFCGKLIDGQLMSEADAKKYRFNNQDLVYFYEQVLQLYKANKESVAGIYWGLEGGYDQAMYTQQIPLMLTTLALQLKEEPNASPCLMC